MSTMRANSVESLDGQSSATVEDLATINKRTIYVGSVAELEALSLHVGTAVYLTEEGRAGEFVVKTGTPPSDPQKGIYIVLGNGNYAERIYPGAVNPKWFGAVGDNNQQLISITPYTSDAVSITEQTRDAIAINAAIKYLASIGGGELYFPKGVYRIYGYLEALDFPITVSGEGPDLSVLRNCEASPTNTNGYGVFWLAPSVATTISFENITVDGDAENRAIPTGEFRCYPIAPTGIVFLKMDNVHLLNSPIDCMRTGFVNNNPEAGIQAVNCKLHNSFRNTLSCVSGWNQKWTNCSITGGGKVHGGTNPKFCLDIEPGGESSTIKDLTFTNCTFGNATNVICGGTWGKAKFVGCTLIASGDDRIGYPFLIDFRGSEIDFIGCEIRYPYERGDFRGLIRDQLLTTGEFADSAYIRLADCEVLGAGLQNGAQKFILENTTFKNSRRSVLGRGGSTIAADQKTELVVSNVTLENVFDDANDGGGTYSSFQTASTFRGPLRIDGLNIVVKPETMPPGFASALGTQDKYGFYVRSSANLTADSESLIKGVHVKGYYQKLPSVLGVAENANTFRDWNTPSSPPADSAGQTVGPQQHHFKDCTMYGNNP